jgi:hypothetical protein
MPGDNLIAAQPSQAAEGASLVRNFGSGGLPLCCGGVVQNPQVKVVEHEVNVHRRGTPWTDQINLCPSAGCFPDYIRKVGEH